ncbi:arabinoxylan arabinofuranohydrolase [Evansella vedderi]|uniref:Arabinoxylan arabinofuranohydrolase n=2 Tax=Evansella vedderi TaxID=38282 RepID=A0ABT9ZPR3_9BACI|nr:arabinoxylan arabinofuranohydrolase [Evansella vedderi]
MKIKNKQLVITSAVIICCLAAVLIMSNRPSDVTTTSKENTSTSNEIASNPIIYADVPDPSVIRVEDNYYMVSTTMHMMPGSPIMRSTDLVNWEIIGYPYDRLEENSTYQLRDGQNAYGQGTWASSLKYHNGTFYVLTAALDTGKTYLFSAEDPSGNWDRTEFQGYMHDPTLLFDDDDTAYIIYGVEDFHIKELTEDYKAINPDGLDKVILSSGKEGMEGAHAHKINGKYYLTFIWWETGEIRRQYVYRADQIDGPYEGKLVLSDTMGNNQNGVAQGGLVDTPDGDWYAMLFQDHGAVGRVPVLVPVHWEDDWPVFGDADGKVPLQFEKSGSSNFTTQLTKSDDFYQEEPVVVEWEPVQSESTASSYNGLGEELVKNGDFSMRIMDWWAKDGAKVSIIPDDSDSDNFIAHITERPSTIAGIGQNFTGRIVPGERYKANFRIKYEEGPETKEFVLTAKKIQGSDTSYANLVRGTVKRGEWTELSGTFTIDGNPNMLQLFFETPWTENPDPVNDNMDFYLDSVSIKASPQSNEDLSEAMPNGSELGLHWQWNHNPNNSKWSLTERKGFLRLTTDGVVSDIHHARNTLTQRSQGPESSGWIAMDTSSMLDGDYAGLAAFQQEYGFIGVTQEGSDRFIVMVDKGIEKARKELKQELVYLKIDFDFLTDTATFFYSLNGSNWTEFGTELQMQYTLPHFMGYRFALFNYATQIEGGHVDFDFFKFSNEKTGSTTPSQLTAYLKEDVIELSQETDRTYDVRLLLNDIPEGKDVREINAMIQIPEVMEVREVIPNSNNLQADNVFFEHVEEGILLKIHNNEDSAVFFTNQDTTMELVTIKIKQKQELKEIMSDEIKVNNLESVDSDGQLEAYDVRGAVSKVNFTPPNSALGKLPPNGNPLVSHKFGADPFALVFEDRVYIYATNDVLEYDEHNNVIDNTYGNINKLSVISSDDLVNWTDHGVINVAGPDGAAKWATQSWAPAAAHKVIDGEDKFFLYFSNNASGIGVLTSESPLGPWVDPIGEPLISRSTPGVEDVTWIFDPAVLVDDDGKGYLYFGGGIPEGEYENPNTARVMELGEDMVSVVGEAVPIPAPFMFENSGINKVNGIYYYTYCSNFYNGVRPEGSPAAGEIAYMTSDNPMGPWTYQDTILKNPAYFFEVGGNNHHAIFQFHDTWYIAYHAQTLSKEMGIPKGYRSTHLNNVYFNEDGSIQEVNADMKGVEQIKHVNPFERVEAENFAWNAGIQVEPIVTEEDDAVHSTNLAVTDINNGDWTAVSGVDFGEGASEFSASVSSGTDGSAIELRLGDPTGKLIGTLTVPNTGWNQWTNVSTEVSGVEGVHDLYFVYRGKSNQKLFMFDSWQFSE